MTLKLIKTLWGINEPISPSLFESIKQEGYHGVEVIRLAWQDESAVTKLVQALNAAQLSVVCQVHTTGGFLRDDATTNGEYVYCDEYDVAQHVASFRQQLRECQDVIAKLDDAAGSFVNVHAGVDAWTHEQAVTFLQASVQAIQDQVVQVPVVFETHRQRLFGNPFQTRALLQDERIIAATAEIQLNADLSHWYCACERVFDATEKRDAAWWPDLLAQLQGRVSYIHARFGWAQGPQMANPAAEYNELDRSLQLQVWQQLLTAMKEAGKDCFVCCEYGPAPYLPNAVDAVPLPEAVLLTKEYIEGIFEEFV